MLALLLADRALNNLESSGRELRVAERHISHRSPPNFERQTRGTNKLLQLNSRWTAVLYPRVATPVVSAAPCCVRLIGEDIYFVFLPWQAYLNEVHWPYSERFAFFPDDSEQPSPHVKDADERLVRRVTLPRRVIFQLNACVRADGVLFFL